MMRLPLWYLILLLTLTAGCSSVIAQADLLDDIRHRGEIRCGVHAGLAGFSEANSLEEYSGFDVDICRAVAISLFNRSEAATMVPLTAARRFSALRRQKVDMLATAAAWNADENARSGDFAAISFYDGQGFMIHQRERISSILELHDRPICVVRDSDADRRAADYFALMDIQYRPVFTHDHRSAFVKYTHGHCVAISANRSVLAALRGKGKQPRVHRILPGSISKVPLGLAVPHNQSRWANVVRWTLNCLINAEELGVTSANIREEDIRSGSAVRQLLGLQGNVGPDLGLDLHWCQRVLHRIGNYGELYARHLGPDTPPGLPRGLNALWTNGGLLFAPPVR